MCFRPPHSSRGCGLMSSHHHYTSHCATLYSVECTAVPLFPGHSEVTSLCQISGGCGQPWSLSAQWECDCLQPMPTNYPPSCPILSAVHALCYHIAVCLLCQRLQATLQTITEQAWSFVGQVPGLSPYRDQECTALCSEGFSFTSQNWPWLPWQ